MRWQGVALERQVGLRRFRGGLGAIGRGASVKMEVSNLGEHTSGIREPCTAPFASTGYHPRGFLGPFLRPGPEKWMELDPECDSASLKEFRHRRAQLERGTCRNPMCCRLCPRRVPVKGESSPVTPIRGKAARSAMAESAFTFGAGYIRAIPQAQLYGHRDCPWPC